MKHLTFTLAFILSLSFTIQAQLKGTLIDQDKQPIEFANVALYSLPDSVMITGAVSDVNGNFTLNTERTDNAFLEISFIGYETQIVPAKREQTIVMKAFSEELNEVVITSRRNLFRLENNGVTATVKGTILETLPSTNDVLAQLPFVIGKDDEFTVMGKGQPLIYINNRLVRDNNEIRQLQPKDIKNIQIITSPGAAYDATVKSVIKINTLRRQGDGLSGDITVDERQGRAFSGYEGLSLNYRTGAWDIFGSFSNGHRRSKDKQEGKQSFTVAENKYSQTDNADLNSKVTNYNPSFGINFSPNERNSAGLKYDYTHNDIDFTFDSKINSSMNSESPIMQNQLSQIITNDRTHKLNGYYNGQVTDALSFNLNVDILSGNEDVNQSSYDIENETDKILNSGNKDYVLYAGKGIVNYAFGTNTLSAGAEYAHTDITQTYKINRTDLGLTDSDNKQEQNRAALFASYQKQFGKLNLDAGIRYENIKMDYYESKTLVEEQSKAYDKFFPNVSFSYNDGNYQLQLSYEKKIAYPSYHDLRSNVQYSSPFIYEGGNPLLKASVYHNITAMYIWRDLQVMALYNKNEDAIFTLPSVFENKDVILFRPENVKNYSDFTFGVVYAPTFGIWNPQVQLFMQKQWLSLGNPSHNYNKPLVTCVFNNSFQFKNHWTIRLNTTMYNEGHSQNVLIKPMFTTDLALSKTFLDGKLGVFMGVTDVFHTNKQKWDVNYNNIYTQMNKNIDSKKGYITLKYSFNTTSNKYKGKQASEEINRL